MELILVVVISAGMVENSQNGVSRSLNGKQINCVCETNKDHSIKLLGMYLDKHLTWNSHVNIISSKISKALFIINKVKHLLPHDALKSLYYTLIHSHLTYGIQAWGNASCIKKLFVLQKRVVRIINKIGYGGHTDPIFKREHFESDRLE